MSGAVEADDPHVRETLPRHTYESNKEDLEDEEESEFLGVSHVGFQSPGGNVFWTARSLVDGHEQHWLPMQSIVIYDNGYAPAFI